MRELGWPLVTVDTDEVDALDGVADILRLNWHEDVAVANNWELEVLADGHRWEPSEQASRVSEEIPWLPLVVAVTLRFPRASGMRVGKQLSKALEQLERVRIERHSSLSIGSSSDGQHLDLPDRLRGVLPLPGDTPTLLLESAEETLSWTGLEAVGQGVLELIGQTRFTAELTLTIRSLSSDAASPATEPDLEALAEAVGQDISQLQELDTSVRGAVTGLIFRLSHIAPCVWGANSINRLVGDDAQGLTRDDLVRTLTQLCKGDSARAHEILSLAADAPNANALRRSLDIPLADFNSALEEHFPGHPLISNAKEHLEAFEFRKRERRNELIDRVRRSRMEQFVSWTIQKDWAEIRTLDFIVVEGSWAMSLDELEDSAIDGRIDELMEERLGPVPTLPTTLPEWQYVQHANGRPLRSRLVELKRLVAAREAKLKTSPYGMWANDGFDEEIRAELDKAGALDFTYLSDDALIEWLDRIEQWPQGMHKAWDPSSHGLTPGDLRAQESDEARGRADQLRASRQLTLHGEVVDLDTSMSSLVSKLEKFLEIGVPSLNTAYHYSGMQTMAAPRKGAKDNRRPKTGKGRNDAAGGRLSDAQKNGIGFAGELIAFHWLRRHEQVPVDETCWKSTNVSFAFEGALGDDGLGYDFEVPRRKDSIMYEVKATSGVADMIELGETEVTCARENARNERWRLLIVEGALSKEPRVHMLPNPFRGSSRPQFRIVGNSIRLRFKLDP